MLVLVARLNGTKLTTESGQCQPNLKLFVEYKPCIYITFSEKKIGKKKQLSFFVKRICKKKQFYRSYEIEFYTFMFSRALFSTEI